MPERRATTSACSFAGSAGSESAAVMGRLALGNSTRFVVAGFLVAILRPLFGVWLRAL